MSSLFRDGYPTLIVWSQTQFSNSNCYSIAALKGCASQWSGEKCSPGWSLPPATSDGDTVLYLRRVQVLVHYGARLIPFLNFLGDLAQAILEGGDESLGLLLREVFLRVISQGNLSMRERMADGDSRGSSRRRKHRWGQASN